MSFKQRLLRYLVGVSIGLLMVWGMFGNRNWLKWTPNNRVLERLRHSDFTINAQARCGMECLNLHDGAIRRILSNGDVDFSESDTKQTPMIYRIADRTDDALQMTIEIADSSATLTYVIREGRTCSCP